jgi:hypothetical protein
MRGGGADRVAANLLRNAEANPQDCTRSNANTVMRVPAEFGNPATCFMHAQAYLAGSSIGRDLDASERVKIVCVRTETVAAGVEPR